MSDRTHPGSGNAADTIAQRKGTVGLRQCCNAGSRRWVGGLCGWTLRSDSECDCVCRSPDFPCPGWSFMAPPPIGWMSYPKKWVAGHGAKPAARNWKRVLNAAGTPTGACPHQPDYVADDAPLRNFRNGETYSHDTSPHTMQRDGAFRGGASNRPEFPNFRKLGRFGTGSFIFHIRGEISLQHPLMFDRKLVHPNALRSPRRTEWSVSCG